MPISNPNRTVLLVEDNADDERATLAALRQVQPPLSVHVARDATQAETFLHSDPSTKLPDLILLDLHLPGKSGLDLLRSVRADARTANIPIVVLTSSENPDHVQQSYRARANGFIKKPTDGERFAEEVRLAGTYWTHINISSR